MNAVREAEWPLFAIACPQCRETENLIPLALLEQLPSAVERTDTIAVLRRIEEKEDQGEVHVRERLSTFFDIKLGLHSAMLSVASENEREWYRAKLVLVQLDPSSASVPGLGSRVIPQVLESGRLLGELYAAVRRPAYSDLLPQSFTDLGWMCAAKPASIT
jgi:hypothetical protein